VNVRVVAATNRDLERMVAEGTFRSDLYYRLAVLPVNLPPLRERPADVRPLAAYFLAREAALMHRKPPAVPEAVWAALERHPWPGNIRELENYLQRALILSPGPELQLPEPPVAPTADRAAQPPSAGPPGRFADEVRTLIERALAACGGRVYGPQGAATLLGLKPTTLQGKMRKYGITDVKARADVPRAKEA
jgi:formate hydrogenlyase transcriptional activator